MSGCPLFGHKLVARSACAVMVNDGFTPILAEIAEPSKYLEGGIHPNGHTKVPSLHNLIGRKLFTDANDLAEGLKEGEGGGYDNMSAGGMGEVQFHLAKLPDSDVKAIADYLASLK